MFQLDDIDLVFTDDSLEAMADLALARKTGARGLRSILEKILLEQMYESPSRKDITKIIIDKESGNKVKSFNLLNLIKSFQL
jgi:ATP-dependent Clp protease ATP-binding subunit ClpX